MTTATATATATKAAKATKATKATTTTKATKATRTAKKKDIAVTVPVIPAFVPAPAPAPLSAEETAIVETAKLNISVITLANRFAATQAAATAVLDEFVLLAKVPVCPNEFGWSKDEIKEISNGIYNFIPCWPVNGRGTPVSCSAILAPMGKWCKQDEFFTFEDGHSSKKVPVNVVRLVNAAIKRLYRAKERTIDKQIVVFSALDVALLNELVQAAAIDGPVKEMIKNILALGERKTVKVKAATVAEK